MNMLTSRAAETEASIKTVAVVGLGYIGLPTAAILATNGLEVIGVDLNPKTVEAINNGDVPFVEPDLGIHVAGAVSQGRLRAQLETPSADAYIVAVPTPFKADKSADMSYIAAAARAIAPQLSGGELLILESTSPPGSTRRLAELILGMRPDLSLDGQDGKPVLLVAHCPERVLPGRIMIELVTNDRVVGGLTTEAAEAAAALYAVFCQGEIHLTDAATAEMSKLVENAYRDVNIAFANELSVISDSLDIDVWELIRLANHHPRVNILQPGPGVGGHCIAVDPWFIVAADPENSALIRTAREVNDGKPGYVVDQIRKAVSDIDRPVIACLGLAFKANIDDVRESPAMEIVRRVATLHPDADIRVAAPHKNKLPQELAAIPNIRLEETDAAIEAAQVVVLLVDHDKFREIEPASLEGKRLIDTRGFWR
ncbi:UDP-N-acetyl-D-mannosamine dehydrogenase [Pseudarthrobacter sp. MM222]|uniref:UDP-N-acetyl-D-mannosamine dehydrogenase n=1 Tax=Pseudarthrobacter sp. MM222 TaxID=3018929 RepID=UPI0022205F1F|nr:UDP-N-acetyl-D-mannosamine dehydrogenase [Pseudarthrobacter sp. MM222]CAI3800255.1 UDP-N-acetyl-D-mannosamine dehydrogenase [Pseudarthrobacter sp. MM222]